MRNIDVDEEQLIFSRIEPKVNLQNGAWPREIRVSLEFIRGTAKEFVSFGPAYISFWLSNGRATYHIDRWDEKDRALVCSLKESEGPR